jgi:hypothetical protein
LQLVWIGVQHQPQGPVACLAPPSFSLKIVSSHLQKSDIRFEILQPTTINTLPLDLQLSAISFLANYGCAVSHPKFVRPFLLFFACQLAAFPLANLPRHQMKPFFPSSLAN